MLPKTTTAIVGRSFFFKHALHSTSTSRSSSNGQNGQCVLANFRDFVQNVVVFAAEGLRFCASAEREELVAVGSEHLSFLGKTDRF